MNRFLIDRISPKDKFVTLDDPSQLHHLRDVLRIHAFEQVIVFDNLGNEYVALVSEIGPLAVKLELKETKKAKGPGVKITVACAIPKK